VAVGAGACRPWRSLQDLPALTGPSCGVDVLSIRQLLFPLSIVNSLARGRMPPSQSAVTLGSLLLRLACPSGAGPRQRLCGGSLWSGEHSAGLCCYHPAEPADQWLAFCGPKLTGPFPSRASRLRRASAHSEWGLLIAEGGTTSHEPGTPMFRGVVISLSVCELHQPSFGKARSRHHNIQPASIRPCLFSRSAILPPGHRRR